MSTPVNLSQPSIALAQSIVVKGNYPQYDDGWNDGSTLGMVITTAYQPTGLNLAPANGGVYSYNSNQALASIVGNIYGGTPYQTFALPDLTKQVIVGPGNVPSWYGGLQYLSVGAVQGNPGNLTNLVQQQLPPSLGGMMQPISTVQYGQAINYVIQIEGMYPEGPDTVSTLGNIYPFLGTRAPTGFAFCQGQTLSVAEYPALFSLISTNYGTTGNGYQTFNLPNLTGTVPVGVGGQLYYPGDTEGSASTRVLPWTLSNGNYGALQTMQPSLGLNYIISTTGTFNQPFSNMPMLGEVTLYAGLRPADGWVVCNGQLLSISQYNDLYKLIGTTFGGDGVTTFAVPDLRDRTVVGSGTGLPIGSVYGQASVTLTSSNYPAIVVPVPGVALAGDTGVSGSDFVTSNPNLTLSSIWPDGTTQYSSDGKTWTTSFKSVEGLNTVYVRQIDVVDQASQASRPITFTLDTTAPVTPTVNIEYGFGNLVVGSGGAGATSLSGNLVLSGIETGAKLSYSVDGSKTWSDHFQAVLGNNSVQVRQTDLAGNVSAPSAPSAFQLLSDPTQKASTQVTTLPTGGHEIVTRTPGLIGDELGTSFIDTVHHNLQSALVLPGQIENIVLTGLGGGNIITSNAAANRVDVQSGSWVIKNADAKDTIVFTDNAAQYRLSQSHDAPVTIDGMASSVIVPVASTSLPTTFPKLQFNDVTLVATDAAAAKGLFGLYTGLLNRAPDFTGQAAWQHALDQGLSLARVAEAMSGSTEYADRYGPITSTKDFVLHLYDNALHRTADSRGLSGWINAIDSHSMTKGEVAVAISGSAEAKSLLPTFVLQIL